MIATGAGHAAIARWGGVDSAPEFAAARAEHIFIRGLSVEPSAGATAGARPAAASGRELSVRPLARARC